jgi:PAS domain S-box-containing protein
VGPDDQALAVLAAIVEASDDAIVSKTLDGIVTSWNPAAERMFGYTAAEAVGRHITLIIPRERWSEEEDVLARLRRGEKVEHFETVRVTKDGRLIDISLSVSPVRDAAGQIVGASKIARDISERRRAEVERAQLLAAERAARTEAERANRAKDDFLASLSHELRTPLNAILGWARMLRTDALDGTQRERALESIERNSQVQAQLIEDLLDVSRIAAGKLRLEPTTLDLRTVVHRAVALVRASAEAKHVHLEVRMNPAIVPFVGDGVRLQQVVWNLLTNAIRFTPEGGRVSVSLSPRDTRVLLTVSDTGQGIGADLLPHIFQRFRQGQPAGPTSRTGLGLGLAIVRQIVELHGGAVAAHSDGEGRGATFVVTLPCGPSVSSAPAHAGPALPASGFPQLSNVRVLLVEDDVDSRAVLTAVLRQCGAEVVEAGSSREALEAFGQTSVDILVSDIGLPDGDGYDLIRTIREQSGPSADVPALAVTAFARVEDRRRAMLAGFQTHVSKPVEPLELAVVVANLVGRPQNDRVGRRRLA